MTSRWQAIVAAGLVAATWVVAGTSLSAAVPPTDPGSAGHAPAAFAARSRCWKPRPEERGFIGEINDSRSRGGKGTLRLDPELSKAARVHTREMFERTSLHHTSHATLGNRVTRWALLGENVGVGNTVDSLHGAFMNSPAHRANIMLSSFRFAGIGTRQVDGRLWVTVIFENRLNPGTRLKMPRCRR